MQLISRGSTSSYCELVYLLLTINRHFRDTTKSCCLNIKQRRMSGQKRTRRKQKKAHPVLLTGPPDSMAEPLKPSSVFSSRKETY